jgi:ABC-type phosphate transport system auxiliary subunit
VKDRLDRQEEGACVETGTASKRRRRAHNAHFAAGEPAVWLTGGALAICTAMVTALLVLVLWQGLATFWPQSVVRVTTPDGETYMG